VERIFGALRSGRLVLGEDYAITSYIWVVLVTTLARSVCESARYFSLNRRAPGGGRSARTLQAATTLACDWRTHVANREGPQ